MSIYTQAVANNQRQTLYLARLWFYLHLYLYVASVNRERRLLAQLAGNQSAKQLAG